MKAFLLFLTVFISAAIAGDYVDLGMVDTVPDWAIGPLLTIPVDRVRDGHLVADRSEAKRIGTIQSNYIELEDSRLAIDTIHLSEVPNDGHSCTIKTVPENGYFYDIHLSQTLFDQTFYYVYIQKIDATTSKPLTQDQWVIWDIKSR